VDWAPRLPAAAASKPGAPRPADPAVAHAVEGVGPPAGGAGCATTSLPLKCRAVAANPRARVVPERAPAPGLRRPRPPRKSFPARIPEWQSRRRVRAVGRPPWGPPQDGRDRTRALLPSASTSTTGFPRLTDLRYQKRAGRARSAAGDVHGEPGQLLVTATQRGDSRRLCAASMLTASAVIEAR
jgi:hypothetical protein